MKFEISITNKINTDVVVVGGGTAGVFAAISAARNGAETVLVEKNSNLGGTMTTAGVSFPGLFYAWGNQIISGPCWEAIEKTVALGGAKIPQIQFQPEHHWDEQILLNRFIYESVLWQMLNESNVTVITNAMLSYIEESEQKINLIITAKEGLLDIEAKIAVDATGDANLVQIAGYPVEKSEIQQPATPRNHISGYNIENVDYDMIRKHFKKANFPEHISENAIIQYIENHMIDIHVPCTNADTSAGKTQLENDSHRILLKIYEFYRNIKGLENLTIDFIASETGVRETNRIVGENFVTAEDYIKGTLYPDSVCYAFYPIDLHIMKGIEQTFFKENIVGKIPYGALVPKHSKRILCAGRCIASDTYANSAIRVQAPCMATGQAAGCAAAICSKDNIMVNDVPYNELCQCLKNIGAIIPQK